jgi:hypothetical protein
MLTFHSILFFGAFSVFILPPPVIHIPLNLAQQFSSHLLHSPSFSSILIHDHYFLLFSSNFLHSLLFSSHCPFILLRSHPIFFIVSFILLFLSVIIQLFSSVLSFYYIPFSYNYSRLFYPFILIHSHLINLACFILLFLSFLTQYSLFSFILVCGIPFILIRSHP